MDLKLKYGEAVFKVHSVTRDGGISCSVRRLGDDDTADVDASPPLQLRAVGPGEFVVEGPAGPRRGFAVRDGGVFWVHFAGVTWRLDEARDAALRRPGTAQAIAAPMPGQVLRVLVEVGDIVEKGQALLVVEAMKMQLEISAPHAGTVRSVAVGPGDKVAPGVPLAEVEPEGSSTEPA
jgi:acetyl/propionyl-CoA carboxylase alpha subunit